MIYQHCRNPSQLKNILTTTGAIVDLNTIGFISHGYSASLDKFKYLITYCVILQNSCTFIQHLCCLREGERADVLDMHLFPLSSCTRPTSSKVSSALPRYKEFYYFGSKKLQKKVWRNKRKLVLHYST